MAVKTHDSIYRIRTQGGGKTYVLELNKKEYGTLAIRGRYAILNCGAATLELARRAMFKKHLHIHQGARKAVFEANALSGGTLKFGGHIYHWVPKNTRWTKWAWQDSSGKTIITIQLYHLLGSHYGRVISPDGLSAVEKKLALIGWYLLLLSHQDFGFHVMDAFRLVFAPKAA